MRQNLEFGVSFWRKIFNWVCEVQMFEIIIMYRKINPMIGAATLIEFLRSKVRLLFEGGFYSKCPQK